MLILAVNSFATSLPRVEGFLVPFLWNSFAVSNTMATPFLDHVVQGTESIQSYFVTFSTGFAFNQEVSAGALHHSLIPTEKTLRALHFRNCFALLEQLYIAHFTNHRLLFVTEWVCRRYSVANRLEELRRWGWLSILFTSSRTRKFSACFTTRMWQSRHSEVDVYVLALCEQTDGLSTFHRSSPFLFDLRLRFRPRLCLYLQVQQTLAHNSGWMTMLSPFLEFVFSRPNKTSFPISWVNEPDGCSLTGFPVLDNRVFNFGWIRWTSLLLPATSESNSFIRLSLKGIFGGGRGDAYTFSKMISPDSIKITFGIQQAGSVS